jgi:hypothetical protein
MARYERPGNHHIGWFVRVGFRMHPFALVREGKMRRYGVVEEFAAS